MTLGKVAQRLESARALVVVLEEEHVDVEVAKQHLGNRLISARSEVPATEVAAVHEGSAGRLKTEKRSRTHRHKWTATVMLAGFPDSAKLMSFTYCIGSVSTSSPRSSAAARISSEHKYAMLVSSSWM